MICERCQGSGIHKIVDNNKWGWYISEPCYLCDGKGETDWISEIFKQKQTKSLFGKIGKSQFYYMDYLKRIYPNINISINFYVLDRYFSSKEKK